MKGWNLIRKGFGEAVRPFSEGEIQSNPVWFFFFFGMLIRETPFWTESDSEDDLLRVVFEFHTKKNWLRASCLLVANLCVDRGEFMKT